MEKLATLTIQYERNYFKIEINFKGIPLQQTIYNLTFFCVVILVSFTFFYFYGLDGLFTAAHHATASHNYDSFTWTGSAGFQFD